MPAIHAFGIIVMPDIIAIMTAVARNSPEMSSACSRPAGGAPPGSTSLVDGRSKSCGPQAAFAVRPGKHPNIRTSEHHIFSRPLLSVRMFGSWGKKRANASANCAAL
jgi:hypothetical protein